MKFLQIAILCCAIFTCTANQVFSIAIQQEESFKLETITVDGAEEVPLLQVLGNETTSTVSVDVMSKVADVSLTNFQRVANLLQRYIPKLVGTLNNNKGSDIVGILRDTSAFDAGHVADTLADESFLSSLTPRSELNVISDVITTYATGVDQEYVPPRPHTVKVTQFLLHLVLPFFGGIFLPGVLCILSFRMYRKISKRHVSFSRFVKDVSSLSQDQPKSPRGQSQASSRASSVRRDIADQTIRFRSSRSFTSGRPLENGGVAVSRPPLTLSPLVFWLEMSTYMCMMATVISFMVLEYAHLNAHLFTLRILFTTCFFATLYVFVFYTLTFATTARREVTELTRSETQKGPLSGFLCCLRLSRLTLLLLCLLPVAIAFVTAHFFVRDTFLRPSIEQTLLSTVWLLPLPWQTLSLTESAKLSPSGALFYALMGTALAVLLLQCVAVYHVFRARRLHNEISTISPDALLYEDASMQQVCFALSLTCYWTYLGVVLLFYILRPQRLSLLDGMARTAFSSVLLAVFLSFLCTLLCCIYPRRRRLRAQEAQHKSQYTFLTFQGSLVVRTTQKEGVPRISIDSTRGPSMTPSQNNASSSADGRPPAPTERELSQEAAHQIVLFNSRQKLWKPIFQAMIQGPLTAATSETELERWIPYVDDLLSQKIQREAQAAEEALSRLPKLGTIRMRAQHKENLDEVYAIKKEVMEQGIADARAALPCASHPPRPLDEDVHPSMDARPPSPEGTSRSSLLANLERTIASLQEWLQGCPARELDIQVGAIVKSLEYGHSLSASVKEQKITLENFVGDYRATIAGFLETLRKNEEAEQQPALQALIELWSALIQDTERAVNALWQDVDQRIQALLEENPVLSALRTINDRVAQLEGRIATLMMEADAPLSCVEELPPRNNKKYYSAVEAFLVARTDKLTEVKNVFIKETETLASECRDHSEIVVVQQALTRLEKITQKAVMTVHLVQRALRLEGERVWNEHTLSELEQRARRCDRRAQKSIDALETRQENDEQMLETEWESVKKSAKAALMYAQQQREHATQSLSEMAAQETTAARRATLTSVVESAKRTEEIAQQSLDRMQAACTRTVRERIMPMFLTMVREPLVREDAAAVKMAVDYVEDVVGRLREQQQQHRRSEASHSPPDIFLQDSDYSEIEAELARSRDWLVQQPQKAVLMLKELDDDDDGGGAAKQETVSERLKGIAMALLPQLIQLAAHPLTDVNTRKADSYRRSVAVLTFAMETYQKQMKKAKAEGDQEMQSLCMSIAYHLEVLAELYRESRWQDEQLAMKSLGEANKMVCDHVVMGKQKIAVDVRALEIVRWVHEQARQAAAGDAHWSNGKKRSMTASVAQKSAIERQKTGEKDIFQ